MTDFDVISEDEKRQTKYRVTTAIAVLMVLVIAGLTVGLAVCLFGCNSKGNTILSYVSTQQKYVFFFRLNMLAIYALITAIMWKI